MYLEVRVVRNRFSLESLIRQQLNGHRRPASETGGEGGAEGNRRSGGTALVYCGWFMGMVLSGDGVGAGADLGSLTEHFRCGHHPTCSEAIF